MDFVDEIQNRLCIFICERFSSENGYALDIRTIYQLQELFLYFRCPLFAT